MEPRISLVTLGVDDLERSRRFYRDGLGLPLSSASNNEVAFFRTRGTILVLHPRSLLAAEAGLADRGNGWAGLTLSHNVASPEAVDELLAAACAQGATLLRAGESTSWGGYTGYFADPDGFTWEVAWNPHFPLDPYGAPQLPD